MRPITRTTWPIRNWWATCVWWALIAVVVFAIHVVIAAALSVSEAAPGDQPYRALGAALAVGQQWLEAVNHILSNFGIVIVGGFLLWRALSSLESRLDVIAEHLERTADVHDELVLIKEELQGIRRRVDAMRSP